jgi:lysyl endopeptidase
VDFSLVELNTFPPITYKPYLAGWDVSGSIPNYTFAIHHPMGDVKKISLDLDPPAISNFTSMPANSAWKIIQWDNGTTEGGSSGSPLFDQNKRIVGILTGGEAVCGRALNDYFVRLNVIYNYSSLLWEQVKGWIDPAVTGAKQLDGRDPYVTNWLTVDTLTNLASSENRSVTKYLSPGLGYSTGFNSDSLVMYAEYFKNPSSGREISEVWLNIAKATSVSTADSVRVWVFGDGVSPGTPIASQKIFIGEAKDSFMLKLDFNTTVPVTGNFYIGWKIWYSTRAKSEPRQFAIYHSPDRVLLSKNTAWFNNGSVWKPFTQHPLAPMSVSLDVKVITTGNSKVNYISENKASVNEFKVYPNPASDKIAISSQTAADNVIIRLIDLTGNILKDFHFRYSFPGEVTLNLAGVQPGFYLVNINSNGISETHKVLINR